MFDMALTGQTISKLRKESNLTQMELAEKLGISFQAVSSWERGTTMPDISKLPELSEIFGTSIDVLLCNQNGSKSTHIIKKILDGEIDEISTDETITGSDIAEIAPILKPNQADEIFVKNEDKFNVKEVIALAPFVGTETLENQVKKSFNGNISDIVCLAPFLGKDAVDSIALRLNDNLNLHALTPLAPFMNKGTLDKLALNAESEGKISEITPLAPFLSKEAISELAKRITEKSSINQLTALAPFINKETLDKLALDALENGNSSINEISCIAPFLSKPVITQIAIKTIPEHGLKSISSILPFLDQQFLDEYIKNMFS